MNICDKYIFKKMFSTSSEGNYVIHESDALKACEISFLEGELSFLEKYYYYFDNMTFSVIREEILNKIKVLES